MLRYAWAYQGATNGSHSEYHAYPVQTIEMRLNRTMPVARVVNEDIRVAIRKRMPLVRPISGELYIFTQ